MENNYTITKKEMEKAYNEMMNIINKIKFAEDREDAKMIMEELKDCFVGSVDIY